MKFILTLLFMVVVSVSASADDDVTLTFDDTLIFESIDAPLDVCVIDDLIAEAEWLLEAVSPSRLAYTVTVCNPCSCGTVKSECLEYEARLERAKEDRIAKARKTIEHCSMVIKEANK